MTIRVMISDPTTLDPTLRVDAKLGSGFLALPVFEQERIVDEVLSAARDRVLRQVVHREPECQPA
jgi:hypothetical protein